MVEGTWRKVAVLLGAVVATGVASATAGAKPAATAYIESPSKNIVCGTFSGGGEPVTLECAVISGLVPPPPKAGAQGCPGDDFASNRVRLGATGKYYAFCAGDPGVATEQGKAPILAYGKTWHQGPFTCISATSAFVCMNSTGNGVFLSRQRWQAV